MARLTKTQIKKYLTFLEEFKSVLGFSDWHVEIATETKEKEALASVEPDILEKNLKIVLSEEFLKKPKNKQANILFHELVHGRIAAHKEYLEEYRTISEEHLANDITRGFEKYIDIPSYL